MKKLISLLGVLALTACEQKPNIDKPINREDQAITTTVHLYNSKDQVEKKYREIYNIDYSNQAVDLLGFAIWNEFRDAQGNPIEPKDRPLHCDIYAVRPTRIDDEATRTLGHELMHCIYGKFHKDGIG